MITALKEFLFDKSVFARTVRVGMFGLGLAAQQGVLPTGKIGWYLGILAQASSLFVPAGEKNPT